MAMKTCNVTNEIFKVRTSYILYKLFPGKKKMIVIV